MSQLREVKTEGRLLVEGFVDVKVMDISEHKVFVKITRPNGSVEEQTLELFDTLRVNLNVALT